MWTFVQHVQTNDFTFVQFTNIFSINMGVYLQQLMRKGFENMTKAQKFEANKAMKVGQRRVVNLDMNGKVFTVVYIKKGANEYGLMGFEKASNKWFVIMSDESLANVRSYAKKVLA